MLASDARSNATELSHAEHVVFPISPVSIPSYRGNEDPKLRAYPRAFNIRHDKWLMKVVFGVIFSERITVKASLVRHQPQIFSPDTVLENGPHRVFLSFHQALTPAICHSHLGPTHR